MTFCTPVHFVVSGRSPALRAWKCTSEILLKLSTTDDSFALTSVTTSATLTDLPAWNLTRSIGTTKFSSLCLLPTTYADLPSGERHAAVADPSTSIESRSLYVLASKRPSVASEPS